MSIDVYLRFDENLGSRDRQAFLTRLQTLNAPDFDVVDEDETRLRIESADENAALVRAQVVVQGLCDHIGIDRALIRRSLESRTV